MTRTRFLVLAGLLALVVTSVGCGPLDTFNPYRRVTILDFQVTPAKQGQVDASSLQALQQAAVYWVQGRGLFEEVATGPGGGPDTLFVEGTVLGFRPDSKGRAVGSFFSGVDLRGLAIIDYRFFNAAGQTILIRRIQSRYLYPAPSGDPVAEAAGADLANFMAWHKSIRPVPR